MTCCPAGRPGCRELPIPRDSLGVVEASSDSDGQGKSLSLPDKRGTVSDMSLA